MSMTQLFKRLNAPLANSRWSWGSVRESDSAVVLRVWQDRTMKHEGRHFMKLTQHEKYEGDETNVGYAERNQQVEHLKQGNKCLMIMCLAKDVKASARVIKSFNAAEIFVGGEVIELNGDTWVELVARIPLKEAAA